MNYNLLTDEEILKDLSRRYEEIRLRKRIKDTEVESIGGISRQVLHNFRRGKSVISLKSFICLLRGIDEVNRLQDILLSPEDFSPMGQARKAPPRRVRDGGKKQGPFRWGDGG